MKGLLLETLSKNLKKVNDKFASKPVCTIENVPEKLERQASYINSRFDAFDFLDEYRKLPMCRLENFTFEDVCKMRFSSTIMMDSTVEHVFDTIPNYEVVRKIKNSWWRWGVGKGSWNELVDVYNGIRSFTLGLPPEFELRLDFTTGYNPCGRSKFSSTFIDGVFAFLIYFHKKHVLTVSFSVMENRRLLIQQVQLVNPKGNRWLYHLPTPHVQYVTDAFARSFSDFTLYMVDGHSLAEKTLADYQSGIDRVKSWLERYEAMTERDYSEQFLQRRREELQGLTTCYAHLKKDAPRLAKLYAQCGNYTRGPKLEVNKLMHRQLQLTE